MEGIAGRKNVLSPKGRPIINWVTILLILAAVSGAAAEDKLIRILHVNDLHGFAEPYTPIGSKEMLGGAAYLAGAVARLRAERPSLLVAAGDMIQGNTWANLSRGEAVIELMNAMKFDAVVVGNHEFDFGQETLKKRMAEATFPFLGANVEGLEELKPYVIKEVEGIKVGLVGVVAEDTPLLTHPDNVRGLTFHSPQEAVEKVLPELRKRADVVVVLSHIGHSADRLLAENVKGIDAIIGGHSHTKVDAPPVIGGTIIVQAWEHAKALGVVDIVYEDGKIKKVTGRLEEIKPAGGTVDKTVEAIVLKYKGIVDSVLNETVGETEVDLDAENIRKKETNLGDLVADVLRETAGADAALINSGAIRKSIPKGEIKSRDVYSVLPFDNYVVAVRLRGREIQESLEHGVEAVEKGAGAFPQVSGIEFKYDPSSPPGSRVKEVQINGKPLVADIEYSVSTLDFIASGGDGYKAFGDAIKSSKDYSVVGGAMKGEKVVYSDPGKWLRDIVIDHIRSHKRINPQIEGRITQVER